MVLAEPTSLPLGGMVRSNRTDTRNRRAAAFAAVGACAVVMCVLAVVGLSSSSSAAVQTELTELPDGKSYMLNMLRDRVRALRGHGEGRDDTVVNKNQDKTISKLYGKLDSEAPEGRVAASYEAALGAHRYQLPTFNGGAALSDEDDTHAVAGLSEVPHIRRAAQLESDKAFKMFQQQQQGAGAGAGGPILLETGAQAISSQQVLQQMPPAGKPLVAAAAAALPLPAQPQQQYALPPQQQQQYAPPPQQQVAPPQYQYQQQQFAPAAQAATDQSDGGLLAPSFVSPPTPDEPIEIGCQGVSFTVQALGLHSSDAVTITLMEGSPPGCTLTQQSAGANPASAVFTWTPSRPEYASLQNQICFLAEDSHRLTRSKCVALDLNPQCEASAPFQPYQVYGQQPPPAQQQPGAVAPPTPYGQQPAVQYAPYAAPGTAVVAPPVYGQAPAPYGQQSQAPAPYAAAPYGQQQQPAPYGQAPAPYGQQPAPYGQQQPYAQQQQPPMQEQEVNPANLPALHEDCAPLFMYVNTDLDDHFYTTNFKELLGGKLHYKFEGVMAGVYAVQHQGMIPVYRYFNDKSLAHMYTLNYNQWGKGTEVQTPEGDRGVTFEGVSFYVYTQPRAGLRPIYMWLDKKKDTMFSITKDRAGPHAKGFKRVGIIGYAGCSPK